MVLLVLPSASLGDTDRHSATEVKGIGDMAHLKYSVVSRDCFDALRAECDRLTQERAELHAQIADRNERLLTASLQENAAVLRAERAEAECERLRIAVRDARAHAIRDVVTLLRSQTDGGAWADWIQKTCS